MRKATVCASVVIVSAMSLATHAQPFANARTSRAGYAAAELRAALQAFRRQALHASSLKLAHPKTGAPLAFESPLAADLAALVALLRADAAAGRT